MEIGKHLNKQDLVVYVNKCLVEYISSVSKYGLYYSDSREIIEEFYKYFNNETWIKIIELVINRCSAVDLDEVSNIAEDLELITLRYIISHYPKNIKSYFSQLCDAHTNIISAIGRVDLDDCKLKVDESIDSLLLMRKFQLNI